MFGMGFAEIMIIAVIAILFLGPDKLPQTLIDFARFFRDAKRSVLNAKETIEEELHIEDIKKEALSYRRELEEGTRELERAASMDEVQHELGTVRKAMEPDPAQNTPAPAKPEVITFAKKKKEAEDDSAPKEA